MATAFSQLRDAFPWMWTMPAEPRSASRVPPGWLPIVDEMCAAIEALVRDDPQRHEFRIDRAAEKFGALSVSWMARGRGAASSDPADARVLAQIHAVVLHAQGRSGRTCQVCGARGDLRRGAPVLTLCDLHADIHAAGQLPREAWGGTA